MFMIIKKFKIFSLIALCLQLNFVDCAAGEEKNNKRKREWKDPKVYKNRNFNKAFPDLAEGFRLVDENLQDFMMPKLKDHYVYQAVENKSGKQTSLLDNTLEQAEKHMIQAMQNKVKKGFKSALTSNNDIDQTIMNILNYATDYKELFGLVII